MRLQDLSDADLLSNLTALCGSAKRLLARIVRYLAEVEQRRLHLAMAHSSLFDFCTRRLGMAEGEAFRRITAARLVRRFPSILGKIERGEIHLSSLCLLRKHLTHANHEELVTAASGKTKRQVQELVAARFPKADVPTSIRKLPNAISPSPSPMMAAQHTPLTPSQVTQNHVTQSHFTQSHFTQSHFTQGQLTQGQLTQGQTAKLGLFSGSPSLPTASRSPATHEASRGGASPPLASPPSQPMPMPMPIPIPIPTRSTTHDAKIEALSPARYRVQLTASTDLRDKIDRATELLRHQNPSGDLAVVLERALDALIANLERQKLGKTTQPQQKQRPADPKHVRRAARREVFERDGHQCAYIATTGERCPARGFLEVDHVRPQALGGASDVSNLRVLCKTHNLFCAEQAFGREHVEQQIRLRQSKSRSTIETAVNEVASPVHQPP